MTFHSAPRIGELVGRRSVIDDVVVKDGRTGQLCFVTVTHHVTAGDRPVLTERQDIVYRGAEAPGGPLKKAPPPAPDGDTRRSIMASAVLLFRYSALTFNSHRIHFDMPYVTDEEGYRGLVVHGPLQAMLLAQYAQDLRGKSPAHFSFRSVSPLIGGEDVILNASPDGDALSLWTAAPGGPVAMQARAEW